MGYRLITSQFDTAPKPVYSADDGSLSLITSQFDTAPKLICITGGLWFSLITSQFDTAPKRTSRFSRIIRV